MKVVIPQIAWHSREPILSIDFDPTVSYEDKGFYRVASGGSDTLVLLWHIKNPAAVNATVLFVSELKRHQKAVNVVKFSPDGSSLASGDDDGYVIVWRREFEGVNDENESWSLFKSLRKHIEDVSDLCWSSDSNFLLSGSVDNNCILWDVKKGSVIYSFSDHNGFVQGVAYDPLEQFCATVCIDRSLRFYNRKNGKLAHRILKYPNTWVDKEKNGDVKENIPAQPVEPETNDKNGVTSVTATPEPKEKKNISSGQLNRMFHDDTLKTFCRRPSFSPRGELFAVPAGLLPPTPDTFEKDDFNSQIENKVTEGSADLTEDKTKKKSNEKNAKNCVVFFCRNTFSNPCAIINTGSSYSVCCRFNPKYFLRKRDNFSYDPDYEAPLPRSERVMCSVAKLNRSKWEKKVMLDTPYRLVYAIAANDCVIVGDTVSSVPLAVIRNIHCTRITDISWSSDGLALITSSTDGYCSIISFLPGELGKIFPIQNEDLPNSSVYPIPVPPKKKKEKKSQTQTSESILRDESDLTPVQTAAPKKKKEKKSQAQTSESISKDESNLTPVPTAAPIKSSETVDEMPSTSKKSPDKISFASPKQNKRQRDDEHRSNDSGQIQNLEYSPSSVKTSPKFQKSQKTTLDRWVVKRPRDSLTPTNTPESKKLNTEPFCDPNKTALGVLSSLDSEVLPDSKKLKLNEKEAFCELKKAIPSDDQESTADSTLSENVLPDESGCVSSIEFDKLKSAPLKMDEHDEAEELAMDVTDATNEDDVKAMASNDNELKMAEKESQEIIENPEIPPEKETASNTSIDLATNINVSTVANATIEAQPVFTPEPKLSSPISSQKKPRRVQLITLSKSSS